MPKQLDDLAVSIAHAVAAANKRAAETGIAVNESLISITQRRLDGELIWRVSYGPRDFVGRRGGDLIVEVVGANATVWQVLRGQ